MIESYGAAVLASICNYEIITTGFRAEPENGKDRTLSLVEASEEDAVRPMILRAPAAGQHLR